MKPITDTLQIAHGARDEHDQPLEPEAQPVDHVIGTVAPVTLGSAPGEGTPMPVRMKANIRVETDALSVITEIAHQCQFCANWDQAVWFRDRALLSTTAEGQRELDLYRKQALEHAVGEELTALQRQEGDPILDFNGKCNALSELLSDRIYTHARASCPSEGPSGPIQPLFKPRPDARKHVVGIRDRILHTAAGKGTP